MSRTLSLADSEFAVRLAAAAETGKPFDEVLAEIAFAVRTRALRTAKSRKVARLLVCEGAEVPQAARAVLPGLLLHTIDAMQFGELEELDIEPRLLEAVGKQVLALLPPGEVTGAMWQVGMHLATALLHSPIGGGVQDGLLSSVCWALRSGDGEMQACAYEALRVMAARPVASRIAIFSRLNAEGCTAAILHHVSVAAASHLSAATLVDAFRILELGMDVACCRDAILAAGIPGAIRSIETSRGLSGQEARLASSLLIAIDQYRTVLGTDWAGRRRRTRQGESAPGVVAADRGVRGDTV